MKKIPVHHFIGITGKTPDQIIREHKLPKHEEDCMLNPDKGILTAEFGKIETRSLNPINRYLYYKLIIVWWIHKGKRLRGKLKECYIFNNEEESKYDIANATQREASIDHKLNKPINN